VDFFDVLHPVSVDTFLGSYWGRGQLHVPSKTARKFENLLRAIDLRATIWRENNRWGDLSLARAGTLASDCPYLHRPASLEVIEAAFDDGYTLVVNNYQTKSSEIATICRAFEIVFFARCTVNLYQTGPNCQGLDAHYDDTDVFVLQLEGCKTWHIHEGGRLDPLPGEPYHSLLGRLNLQYTCEIHAGDVLYIPRGVVHAAHTSDSGSIHLTIAVSTIRWVTLFKHALQLIAQKHDRLRKDVVAARFPSVNESVHAESKNIASQLADWLADSSIVEAALNDLRDEWIDSLDRLPNIHGSGIGHSPVLIGTFFTHSHDQVFSLRLVDGRLILRFVGGTIELDTTLAVAAQFIVSHRQFNIHEIPSLDIAQRLSLVTNLIRVGLLEPL
jgi:ribosomal protein L16 Arg81 hydroxylase